MATDTDATAARLREAVVHAFRMQIIDGFTVPEYGEPIRIKRDPADITKERDAALDTLIQYHREQSAVETLERLLATPAADINVVNARIAAAQARLALLEQGNPAYEEER